MLRYLYFNETIEEALSSRRIHHQLIPMHIVYENGLDEDIVQGLKKVGHQMIEGPYDSGFSSVTAIGVSDGKFSPVFDPRRQGSSSVI